MLLDDWESDPSKREDYAIMRKRLGYLSIALMAGGGVTFVLRAVTLVEGGHLFDFIYLLISCYIFLLATCVFIGGFQLFKALRQPTGEKIATAFNWVIAFWALLLFTPVLWMLFMFVLIIMIG